MSFRVQVVDQETLTISKKKAKKAKRQKKYAALIIVGFLTLAYSFSEVYIAAVNKSLSMLTDGLHNLSDVVQLTVAYIALKKSTRGRDDISTYGWKRTEVIGAHMNACFLVSLCIYIAFGALELFVDPKPLFTDHGYFYIGVAGAGIVVNGLGSIFFAVLGGHGHSHGGHGHSHGGKKKKPVEERTLLEPGVPRSRPSSFIAHKGDGKDLNMSAVFIHYLGDCLASSLLLGAGILAHFYRNVKSETNPDISRLDWTSYLDPGVSLLIAAMLMWGALPLIKQCCAILLQQTPKEIELPAIRTSLSHISGLKGVHDFHMWELTDDLIIASMHACIADIDVGQTEEIKEQIKKVLHKAGCHSSTIQVEILSTENEDSPYVCKHNCTSTCIEDWCCNGTSEAPFEQFRKTPAVELV